jgi:ribosomal protein L16 Arg81 hydroxylase
MHAENPLIRLIDEQDLFGPQKWNKDAVVWTEAVPPDRFFSERAVHDLLDSGLLRKPYFTVLREGIQPNPVTITQHRRIGDQVVHDFADAAGVRAELAQGATLKLNQLEDWHPPTRELIRGIEQRVPAELKGYVFYTPTDNTGMLPHRDPAHVLAVQLEGTKRWRLFASEGQVDARGGLNVDTSQASHDFVMRPGDVLYLPHGYPHVATAQDGTSLHLTLTLTEPGPVNLLEALLARCADTYPTLFGGTGLTVDEKVAEVMDVLVKQMENVAVESIVSTAVLMMRRRTLA